MHRECRERLYPPPWDSDPVMHHRMCVTHVPWCMPGSVTSSFLCSRWRGKRSRHFRCMGNTRFNISGKRPMRRNWWDKLIFKKVITDNQHNDNGFLTIQNKRYLIVVIRRKAFYLNQFWVIFNWSLRNKLRWNFTRTTKLFIQENASG